MSYLHAIILSIVEGITEFLPISSTGHLVLTARLLSIPETDFVKSFEIIIQLGAILAVVVLYARRFINNITVWKNVIIAFLPTAILGVAFYKVIKSVLLGNELVTLAALFLGGIFLVLFEKYWYAKEKVHIHKIEDLSVKQSFLIGLAQSVSMIPGVSRAAATIVGGMSLGMDRKVAVEFSFLLAVPTMLAASGLDLIKTHFSFTGSEWGLLIVGFLGSFIVAIFAIKYFLQFIQHHTFVGFGWYRIILAVVYFLLVH